MDAQSVIERLRNLDRKDKKRQVFGAMGHNYVLNPPLDVSVIEAFELEHGVSLPEDYRQFITEIGNGGAGPAYGVFPFGKHDDCHDLRPWEGGYLVGDVGKPFRFNKAWNVDKKFWDAEPNPPEGTSQDEEDLLWQEWDKILEAKYWNTSIMDGAIPICHLGCALRQWLVINGDQRGFVWDDMRADNRGIAPVKKKGKRLTFSAWYLDWLREAEQQRGISP